ncbi:MAG: VWA domain-containing protein [Sphingobacteriales bacterium]|nr:MAG: VWA domain-containing protein [Sphingobacteriales bacterium]
MSSLLRIIIIGLLSSCALPVWSQTKTGKTDRVLFILDGSAGMNEAIEPGGKSKFFIASEIITAIIDSVNRNNGEVGFALRVFGHQFDKSLSKCEDTRMEVMYSKDNLAQTSLRLNDLKPKGAGSSVYAINKAFQTDINDTAHYRYSVVLLQGDAGSCDADNCTALINSGKRSSLYRLYKVEIGKDGSADKYCMDNVFEIRNADYTAPCIKHIASQFKVRKSIPQPAARPVLNNVVRSEPLKPSKQHVKVPEPVIVKADTQVAPLVKVKEQPVVIKSGSKIKSEDPAKFGQVNLLNISTIRELKIYKTDGGVDKEIMDIFPVGLGQKLIKLPIGHYGLVYTYGYNDLGKKIFEVQLEQTLDIIFR